MNIQDFYLTRQLIRMKSGNEAMINGHYVEAYGTGWKVDHSTEILQYEQAFAKVSKAPPKSS